ncbi:MAG TPA: hypothetical protein VHV51_05175 [Polyangiaceae bacterium]|jgi:hypothetical protein|nr:hypothetical protein [Polyangiaceae bacterium]
MNRRWWLFGFAALAVACGGRAVETTNSGSAAQFQGVTACGKATCDSSEYCVYPPSGCVAILPDAGVCPPGTLLTAPIGSVGGACLSPELEPSCRRLSPGEGSFDCSGNDAGIECDNVSAPIPDRCGRICRTNCS